MTTQVAKPLRLPPRLVSAPWFFPAALLAAAGFVGLFVALLLLRDERLALLLAAVPLAALAVRYPRAACYIFVVLFPLTVGIPRSRFGIPGLRLGEVLLLLACAAVVMHALLQRPWRLMFDEIDVAMLFIVLTGTIVPLLMMQARGQELTADAVNIFLGPLKYYLIYRLIRAVVQSREHVHSIIRAWFIASTVVALVAIGESLNFPGVRDFLHNNYMSESTKLYITQSWRNPVLYRATSVFDGSWNTLGSYSSFTIILAVYYGQTQQRISMLWLTPIIMLNSVALAISGNFASIAGLLGSLIAATIFLRRVPRGMVPIIISVALASVVFSSFFQARISQQFNNTTGDVVLASTFTDRIQLWVDQFLPVLEGQYLLGVGPELPPEVWWGTEESQYLFLLFKGGILYLLSYLLWIVLGVRVAIRAIRTPDLLARMLGYTALCMLLALVYMGISNAYATYTASITALWIVLALASTAGLWAQPVAGKQD